MKNILCLSLCLLVSASGIWAQTPSNTQVFAAENNLKNSPKTVAIQTFSAKGTAKSYTIQQPKRNAPPIKWTLDKAGNILDNQQFDLAMPDFVTFHQKYSYDAKNQLIKIAQLEPSPATIKENTYNADGKLAKQVIANTENKVGYTLLFEYSGDENRPITTITTTDNNNKYKNTTISRYNSKGKIVEEKYQTDKPTEAQTKQFSYDEKDQLIEVKQFDFREKPMNQVNYKYNDKGDLIEYKQSSADNGISTQFSYMYKYDEKDNWTERAEVEKGFVYVVVQRVFTYHE